MSKLTKIITSFFGAGYAPFMQGTFGSLAGLLIYYFVKENVLIYSLTIIVIFILGFIFSGRAEKVYKRIDPTIIVIDEVCGMLIALFLLPYSVTLVVLGFIFFRILDIVKFPPARKIERFGGPWGIMGDDLISALYTNILLRLFFYIFLNR